jgi:ferredoxin
MDEGIPASIEVDREMCQTAAVCLAYHMYELDDEGKAVLLTKNGQHSDQAGNPLVVGEGQVAISDLANPEGKSLEELRQLALESAKICPFNAIIVRDSNGTIIWPQ